LIKYIVTEYTRFVKRIIDKRLSTEGLLLAERVSLFWAVVIYYMLCLTNFFAY